MYHQIDKYCCGHDRYGGMQTCVVALHFTITEWGLYWKTLSLLLKTDLEEEDVSGDSLDRCDEVRR